MPVTLDIQCRMNLLNYVATRFRMPDRLCKPLPRLKAQYLMPTRLHQLTDDIWRDIKDEYGDLLPSIDTVDAELELWQHTTESLKEDDLCQLLTHTDTMFPNIHTIFSVLLTMPVSAAFAD